MAAGRTALYSDSTGARGAILTDGINLPVLWGLASRARGEVISADAY